MATRNEIKLLRSLQQKKFRQLHRLFVVEGTKSVLEVLQSGFRVESVHATDAWVAAHPGLQLPGLQHLSEKECELASSLQTPPGILACVHFRETAPLTETADLPGRLLILDGIQDSGNLGTIIRTADWFGLTHIVCSRGTVELYNPKTIQASMGSFTRVEVCYEDLTEFIPRLPADYRVYGTFMDGCDLRQTQFAPHAAIVIGSEARGISPEVEGLIHERIAIARIAAHPVDSLNAAIAAAITCYALSE